MKKGRTRFGHSPFLVIPLGFNPKTFRTGI